MNIAQIVPSVPSHGLPARQGAIRTSGLMDFWTILLLTTQVFGTFTPAESYFGTFGGIQNYPITPASLVIVSVTVALMYMRLRARGPVMHSWLSYAFLLAAFASCTWSLDPQLSFQRALRLLPAVALGVIYAQYYGFNRLLRLMVIGFLISALLSLAMGALVPSLGLSHLGNGYDNAWRGAMTHKNYAGFTYAMGVMMTVFAYMKRLVSVFLSVPTILACLAMVLLADSATSAVSMCAALGVALSIGALAKMPPTARIFAVISFGLALALLAFVSLLMPDIAMMLIGRDLSFTGRTDIWAAALDKIWEHPIFGMGYAYWNIDSLDRLKVWRTVGYSFAHAHNSWLDLWLQAGLAGLACLSIVMVAAFARTLRLSRKWGDKDALILLTILLALLIRSFTETEFTEPGTTGVFWLVWASVTARQMEKRHG